MQASCEHIENGGMFGLCVMCMLYVCPGILITTNEIPSFVDIKDGCSTALHSDINTHTHSQQSHTKHAPNVQ